MLRTLLLVLVFAGSAAAVPPASAEPKQAFQAFQPFAAKYCLKCHNGKQARGELNLAEYQSAADVTGDFRRWSHVIEFIRDGEMPPEDEAAQPTPEQRQAAVAAIESILLTEARKHAGDPGVVLPRRLSNTEYDLSVRDLTGVDIRPTREFPVDPAGGEGFDNTGEALTMSPSLLKKQLGAAQHVADHLVLKTDGIAFAPFPVTSYSERKKLTEQAIIDFYARHEVRIEDYLKAAWRYEFRGDELQELTIEAWARRHQLSPKYLSLVWKTLNRPSDFGFAAEFNGLWLEGAELARKRKRPDDASVLPLLQELIEFTQRNLGRPKESLIRSNAGNWPIGHLDFRTRVAAGRDKVDPSRLNSETLIRFDRLRAPKEKPAEDLRLWLQVAWGADVNETGYVVLKRPLFSKSSNLPKNEKDEEKQEVVTLRAFLEEHDPDLAESLKFGKHPLGHEIDRDSIALKSGLLLLPLSPEMLEKLDGKHLLIPCQLDPEHSKERYALVSHFVGDPDVGTHPETLLIHKQSRIAERLATSAEPLCGTFPNRFFYVDDRRGLAAGFHLVEGFFRDDRPLVEKVLDEKQTAELDQLWEELDFVTNSAETLLRGFVWFERSERHVLHDKRFDFLRPEDPRLVDEQLLGRFEREYLDKMGVKLVEGTLKPQRPSEKYEMIHGFFQQIRRGLAHRRELMRAAEQKALEDLTDLARRAYARPLVERDRERLLGLYRKLRKQGQDVEPALRGVMTAILMSPEFCCRLTPSAPGKRVHELADYELASRLSYFLWSSLPDEPLLQSAHGGKLHDERVLREQTRRMLKDPKVAALSREFFAQWLRYRDFLTAESIDTETYPAFTDELREAMFQEPIRLATHLIQLDRPIIDLLDSDSTFVNETLAKHYGGAIAKQYRERRSQLKGEAEPGPEEDVWLQVDGLREAGRGGVLGMGVILTSNSAGARTSPVKRGFWTVHHLLGQHFPPPPADVPELPPGEKQAAKTIRELISEHTANAQCAMCHKHFDSLGMALESFDAIGRTRSKDLAGRPIDDVVQLPNGQSAAGLDALIEYVKQHRRRDFVRTFCRKFLGYALGRSVLLSDQPLLERMERELENNDHRFSVLFEAVVTSPQFRTRRGRDFATRSR